MKKDLSTARLAVLIDADNFNQPALAEALLTEVAQYGVASVRRIYGDWTRPNLGSWKKVLNEHAIQPMQQFSYTTGKNSTDSAMIIDAMDLLYTERFDGFCIVSSDSDFTRLAARIREAGLTVYGFGEQKTPKPFVAACDKFIYLEVLQGGDDTRRGAPGKRQSGSSLKADNRLLSLIRAALDAAAEDDGWAHLGPVGQHISKQAPDFDPRNWGYRKLSDLIRAVGLFELREPSGRPGEPNVVRLRELESVEPAKASMQGDTPPQKKPRRSRRSQKTAKTT